MSHNYHQQCVLPTQIELPTATKVQVIAILNLTLATTVDLRTQVKHAYWNITGNNCAPLQELFADMAAELEEYIDIFAERITDLGGLATTTTRVAAELSLLPEYPHGILDSLAHVIAVSQHLKLCAQLLIKESVETAKWGDFVTSDLYAEVAQVLEQRLWLLLAHLQAAMPQGDNHPAFQKHFSTVCSAPAIA